MSSRPQRSKSFKGVYHDLGAEDEADKEEDYIDPHRSAVGKKKEKATTKRRRPKSLMVKTPGSKRKPLEAIPVNDESFSSTTTKRRATTVTPPPPPPPTPPHNDKNAWWNSPAANWTNDATPNI